MHESRVIGQGYVGLPVAMRASEVGFDVVGYEISVTRAEALANGHSHVGDVTAEQLQSALARGYHPTSDPRDLNDFDVAIISVPTPLRDGMPDLSFIESAAQTVGDYLRPGACVILESTTYPGTTEEFVAPRLETASGLAQGEYLLGYSPERIDPGNAVWGLVNTPKVVSGVDDASLKAVDAFFSAIVDETVPVGSTAEAELTKLLENTFRHVNVALVNELAMFAKHLDVDVWRAIDAASTKPFGFMRFTPGPGVGGHCLPIDPSYLAWRVKQHLGQTFRFVELANDVNEHMPDHVAQRVASLLNDYERSVKGTRILLLGLAYKANTSDWRESPSVAVAEQLTAAGAHVTVCDPHVETAEGDRLPYTMVPFDEASLATADLVVTLVDHALFDATAIARHAPLVFDAKNMLRGLDFCGEIL